MFFKCLLKNFTVRSFFNNKTRKLVFGEKRSFSHRAYVHRVGKEPLVYKNLGEQVLKYADLYSDRTALIACEENLRLTYAEVLTEAEKLAVQLKEMGLKRGEHLGIWAPNISQWYIAFVAGVLGGFPVVCLNPALEVPEMEYALQKSEIKVLITMAECGLLKFSKILDVLFQDGTTKFPDIRLVVVDSQKAEKRKNQFDFDELLKGSVSPNQTKELRESLSEISPESPCNLQFTSGTTGQPKATVLTHFGLVNNSYDFGKSLLLSDSQKFICITVPFFHIFGLCLATAAFQHGSTIVLPSSTFNANAALDAVEKENCNLIVGTPTMYVDLLESQRMNPRSVNSLELGFIGGAACSPEIVMQIKRDFCLKHMRIGYGATELTGATFVQDGNESFEQATLSVGKLFDHGEAKVINDKSETVPFGVSGELCVRGYFAMKGYYKDEARTREVISSDGWFKTGDEFILEPTGDGRIMGRKKDMIIRGGENIFPKEIEDFLDTHESILEAQVIGVPDKRLGEEVCVFLRLKSGAKLLTVSDIKSFCEGKLAYFKIPRYVQIIEEFPKTRSGKIQKFKLKDMFKK